MRNRWFLLLGGLFLVGGIIVFFAGSSLAGLYLAGMGAVLVLAGFLVGPRYRAELQQPPEGYTFTGERFVDPGSRRTVEVWQHPQSGQRVYVLAQDSDRSGRGS
jgi:hypothetical protein